MRDMVPVMLKSATCASLEIDRVNVYKTTLEELPVATDRPFAAVGLQILPFLDNDAVRLRAAGKTLRKIREHQSPLPQHLEAEFLLNRWNQRHLHVADGRPAHLGVGR